MINFAIPSSNRIELLESTTLKILNENNINHITIFVPESQTSEYESHFPDVTVVGCPEKGIGRTRTFIRQYYPVGTKVIMIDDDILDICSIEERFQNLSLIEYFEECFEVMLYEEVRFAGFCPYDNEYYMKPGYTTTPKYTGGHLILEVIRSDPIKVYINHFEDYVANALYYIMDKKLLRFNGTYVKTKYFNPKGGIIDYYGGLEKRKKMATQLANLLTFIFRGLLNSGHNKTHDIINLKFNFQFKLSEKSRCQMINTYNQNRVNLEDF